MKTLIGVVCIATMLFINSPEAHALFGHTAKEQRRRLAAEQQLSEERQRLDAQQQLVNKQQERVNHWQAIALVLGTVAVITLIVGTAIGSKGRRHATMGK